MRLTLAAPKALEFEIGQSQQRLTISRGVLKHLKRHQQRSKNATEAGGQLFARLCLEEVVIEQATGPRESDYRTRTLYVPDRFAEQPEIDFWHKKQLHYVGDWHTHPEEKPQPSRIDGDSVRESFLRSKHSLKGFLLMIVGTAGFPLGLYVTLNNAENALVLVPRRRLIPGGERNPDD
jgi:integrative and conjugative element protein (TIGR02256 family)